jgi:hypothetical protein
MSTVFKKVKESTIQPWILCRFFHENRSSFKAFERIGTDGSLILTPLGQRTRTSERVFRNSKTRTTLLAFAFDKACGQG